MEIRKVYVTSKGKFWSREEALKKKNRVKITDPRSPEELEPVREEWVMLVGREEWVMVAKNGKTSEPVTVFQLTEVTVNDSL